MLQSPPPPHLSPCLTAYPLTFVICLISSITHSLSHACTHSFRIFTTAGTPRSRLGTGHIRERFSQHQAWRLSGDSWGQAPSCTVGGRGRWVCPWQAWPSQAFLHVWLGEVRCGGPKVRGQQHRDAALGALESQEQTVSKCQYFWTGNKHYANEMQKDANHGHSISVQSYFG